MICSGCGFEGPHLGGRCGRCQKELAAVDRVVDHTEVLGAEIAGEDSPAREFEHDHTMDLEDLSGSDSDHTIDNDDPLEEQRTTRLPVTGPLEVGADFGDRYRIDKLLGFGGMGAVYKAWDEQVDIPVALKVVRTGVTADPEMTRQLDRRFKRELLLARQVTHKNVVRIHDLGEVGDIKYITMTFIEGEDLSHVLKRENTLSVSQSLKILRPALDGLVAAHEAGVVHRDLKPANIMVEPATGESFIMDFGIAKVADSINAETLRGAGRVLESDSGETNAGGLVGTLQYMAPEQISAGRQVDERADVYAFGLIFYDLLVGRRRIEKAPSAISEFHGRVENAPPAPQSIDSAVPDWIDEIVSRCIDPDPDARFQTSLELKEALDRLDGEGHPLPVKRLFTPKLMAAAGALLVALVAGTWWLASVMAPAGESEPISVLVADFVNETGDASFDGALEQTLAIAMEGASFISAFPSANARKIADQIEPGSVLDENMARLISRREGVSVILLGSITGGERGYGVTVEALDPGVEAGEGRPLATARAAAKDKDGVLAAVAKAAAELRGDLGDSTPKSDRLAAAETFTTASLDAMRAYARGQDLTAQGNFEDALISYEAAVEYDPEFGRAYAGMGVVYGNLRQEEEAETSYKKALAHLDRMSERERYRTLGGYYLLLSQNYEKAIESYQALVDAYPADGVGHSNLAFAYLSVRDFDRAVESGRQALDLEPGNVIKRINYAMYAMYAGDFETAINESRIVLEQNPQFGYALFNIGRAAGAAGDMKVAHEAFDELAASGGMGSSLAPMGHGDLALYRGRNRDAIRLLEPAVERSENRLEKASMQVALAEARFVLGDTEGAIADVRSAIELSEHESVLYFAARVLLAAGSDNEAEEIAITLENRAKSLASSLSGLIRAEIALNKGQHGSALREIRWAREEYDFWMVHYLAGLAYMKAEQYPEAYDEFDYAVRRRGEATDVFLMEGATLRIFPPALFWQGRAHDALGNPDAARSLYDQFLAIRGDADPPDPLAADVRARLQ